jgi:hypothetical protein
MPSKPLNSSMQAAKASKQDEFYTQLSDIEKELRHYAKHFKGSSAVHGRYRGGLDDSLRAQASEGEPKWLKY